MKEEKWLGDYLADDLKRSLMLTIRKRAAKTRRAAFEILNIVKDYRVHRIGGFLTSLVLWKTCVIPSLFYNCSTWIGFGKEEIRVLEDLQDFFLRMIWG